MGQFRDRYERELQIRGYSFNTVKQYVYCVRNLVKYFNQPPDKLTVEDINNFQLHLTKERKVAWATFNIYVVALNGYSANPDTFSLSRYSLWHFRGKLLSKSVAIPIASPSQIIVSFPCKDDK